MNNTLFKIIKKVIKILDKITELFFTKRIKKDMLKMTFILYMIILILMSLGFPFFTLLFLIPSLTYLFIFQILEEFEKENKIRGNYFDIFRDK